MEKWVVFSLLLVILSMVWVGFIALDKKIDKALDEQGKINQVSFETNEEQSAAIRQLKTDSAILMNIALYSDYYEESDNDEYQNQM